MNSDAIEDKVILDSRDLVTNYINTKKDKYCHIFCDTCDTKSGYLFKSLDNLQPLWTVDNLRKSDKWGEASDAETSV